MAKINKIRLYCNNTEKSLKEKEKIEQILKDKGLIIDDSSYDLALAIGGDGTFLRMVKSNNFNSDIYYIGINSGRLGFLQEIKVDEYDIFINDLLKEEYQVEEVGIQETTIKTKEKTSTYASLNEIVIRDKNLKTTKLEVKIVNDKLEDYIGDGLLISTSVGSTAYNLCYGGSIVYNTFDTLQITPIAPLNSKVYRSLVNSVILPSNKLVTITPLEKNDLFIAIDGESHVISGVEQITTQIKSKKIKCLRLKKYNFPEKINEKFLKD